MTHFQKLDEIHQRTADRFPKFGLIGAAHGTTKQHYEKYKQMCKVSGLAIKDTDLHLFKVANYLDLQRRYVADRNLNNIPLRIFDRLWAAYRAYNPRPPFGAARTQAEYTCCMKWLLLYEILMLEPEFVD